jgi:hypothetical protein
MSSAVTCKTPKNATSKSVSAFLSLFSDMLLSSDRFSFRFPLLSVSSGRRWDKEAVGLRVLLGCCCRWRLFGRRQGPNGGETCRFLFCVWESSWICEGEDLFLRFVSGRKVCEPVGVGVAAALAKGKGKTLGGGLVFRGKGPAAGGRGKTAWVLCFLDKSGAAAWKIEKRGATGKCSVKEKGESGDDCQRRRKRWVRGL